MNAPGMACTFVSDKFVENPGVLRLTVPARKAARRNAKAFPEYLRAAYWRGFVEGCTGVSLEPDGCSIDEQVAYVCGGIDGSAWA